MKNGTNKAKTTLMKHMSVLICTAVAALGVLALSAVEPVKAPLKPKPYPLKKCIVTDEALDKDAHSFIYQGQELKTCCKGCKDDFDAEPAKYLKKLPKADPKAK